MNLLQYETSPYLLQHAGNPVHWMPWSEEAFQKAKDENKPVLISIGYSSCHWCHVMEHESFEDEETASLMNTLCVNIKVDREEYPDVDHMYMDAVQAMTGSGGWPLNVFVTPDKKPFYGGTYFPPVRAHGRASWKEVLINVSQYFTQNRNDVETQAAKLLSHLKQSSLVEKSDSSIIEMDDDIEAICTSIKHKILENADSEEGGFGTAPKFPSTFSIKFLLDHYAIYKDEKALQHALLSLEKMKMGGIYDQIGGGFSRYSTDKFWIAPHFEKMLYDNSLLIEVYAIAFSITKNEAYKNVIFETVDWLKREMMNDACGFYSAQDADSEGEEGKYYTWSYNELRELLKDDFEDFATYYQIKENGNWEHTNILYSTYESNENLSDSMRLKLPMVHRKLLNERMKRIRPLTDDKILLGWNALMNKALVTAYIYCDESEFLLLAVKNMNFLLTNLKSDTHLFFHTYKNGVAKIPAYLDDLAYLADALIALSNITANLDYLIKANQIADFILSNFGDEESPFYSFANKGFVQVEVNKKEIYDGALPSPNSILCSVFYQLGHGFMSNTKLQKSSLMMNEMSKFYLKYPSSFAKWCSLVQTQNINTSNIVIVGEDASKIYKELKNKKYNPSVTYVTTKEENTIESIRGKYQSGETLIYICRNFNCLQPFRDVNYAFTEIWNFRL